VLDIADRVTVLRRGKTIGTIDTAGADEPSLARMMVGRDVVLRVDKAAGKPGDPLLEIDDVHALDDRGLPAVDGVSIQVRAGEIVAVAGIDGNGQTELIDLVSGLRPCTSGHVRLRGQDITNCSPRAARAAGIGHIAEDRHARGLVLDFNLSENLALMDYRAESRFGLLKPRRMFDAAKRLLHEFDVRGGTPATPARSLSGGNQQKVVIAREISGNPDALIAAQPTRGLDVGAIEFVHRRLLAERDAGRAILLFSLELEEIRALADRIVVIYDGRIVGELPPTASDEELGLLMTGSGAARVAGP
jgi:simple sugar transport system ATP-binding protein